MIRLLHIISFFFLIQSYSANAQGGFLGSSFNQSNKRTAGSSVNDAAKGAEKIKQLKTVYMVKELDLQQREFNDFWNTYAKYEQELNKIWADNRNDRNSFETKTKQLQKDYILTFQKILGTEERANKVFITEANFRQMLRKELKDRR